MGHRQWCLTQGFGRLYVAVTESTIWLTNFAIIHLQCLPCRVKWRPSGTSLGARHMGNKSKLFRQYPAFTGSLCPVKYGRPFSSMVLSHDNWCSGWTALCLTSSAVLQQQPSCLPQDLSRTPRFMTQQCFILLGCNIASLVFQALWLERRTVTSSKHRCPRAKCLCGPIDCGDISDGKGEWRQFCHGITVIKSSFLSTYHIRRTCSTLLVLQDSRKSVQTENLL